ncbi:tetratricopeptide repeat protein [bacterium]|nr:tetratricopeptide repeat protein [bacterium]
MKIRTNLSQFREIAPWVLPLSVAVIATVIRILYLAAAAKLPTFLSPGMDAEIYRKWADSLIQGNSPDIPFFRAPFYPYFIAVLGKMFHGDTFWSIRIIQIFFSSLSASLLAVLARRWLDSSLAGWIAGVGWAIYGLSIYFDGEGLIASLYTSFFILLIYLLDHHRNHPTLLRTIFPILTLGILTLLRANALLWWIVVPVLLIKQSNFYHKRFDIEQTRNLIIAILLLCMIVTPTILHNLRAGGGFAISTQGGINLYLGNHPSATGAYAVDPDFGNDWTREQIEHRAEDIEGRSLTAAEISRFYTRLAWKYWTTSPVDAIELTVKKFLLIFNNREIGNNRVLLPFIHEVSPLLAGWVKINFALIAILGLSGLVYGWRKFTNLRPAIVLAGVHLFGILPFFITARYRFPITPVLLIGSTVSLIYLTQIFKKGLMEKGLFRKYWQIGIVALTTTIIVLAPSSVHVDSMPIDQWLFHQANAALRLNRLEIATTKFHEVLHENSNYKDAALNLGVIHLRQSDFDSAGWYFERELETYPDNVKALNNMGVVEERNDNLQESRAFYQQALLADPTHLDARINLARIYNRLAAQAMQIQDVESAYNYQKLALETTPKNLDYNVNFAVYTAAKGDIREAERLLRDLLDVHPDHPGASRAFALLSRFEESDSTSIIR